MVKFNVLGKIYKRFSGLSTSICFVGHKTGINPGLTLRENCFFDLHYQRNSIEELASLFKLEHHLNSPCGLLSAGQEGRWVYYVCGCLMQIMAA